MNTKLHFYWILLPLVLLIGTTGILLYCGVHNAESYVNFQKEFFLLLNQKLSQFPQWQHNITQLGDVLVLLSLLSFLLRYNPSVWQSLIVGILVSTIFSISLKEIIGMPRPYVAIGEHFTIIGKTLEGNNSLPSGHSITIWTGLSILMFSFVARKTIFRILEVLLLSFIGFLVMASRVAVGAHYPLDTIFGGIIGLLSGILGIFLCQRFQFMHWIVSKKYLPIFVVLFSGVTLFLIYKFTKENLPIYGLSIVCLLFSIISISRSYVQK